MRRLATHFFGRKLPTTVATAMSALAGSVPVKTDDSIEARAALDAATLKDLTLVQTGPLTPGKKLESSDHKRFRVTRNGNAYEERLVWNMTMQGLTRRTNGYHDLETNDQYDARTVRLAHEIAADLSPNAMAHFQEFMISQRSRHLFMSTLKKQGYDHQLVATRTMSVATLLPENSPFRLDDEIMREINSDSTLIGRFLVFRTCGTYEINGHLPFRNTEEALVKFYEVIFRHASKNVAEGHDVSINASMDTNLPPETQKALVQKAYWNVVKQQAADDSIFEATSYHLSSKDCHLQDEGDGKKVLVSVDSFQEHRLKSSEKSAYHQATKKDIKKHGFVVSLLIGGGVVVMNMGEELASEVALEGAAFEIAEKGAAAMLRAGFFANAGNALKQQMQEQGEHPLVKLSEHTFGSRH